MQSFKRLLKDPLSINVPGGVNPLTLIKEEIRKCLITNSPIIKNDIIKSSIDYLAKEQDRLIEFLRSVNPLFPKFLSEYLTRTYIEIVRNQSVYSKIPKPFGMYFRDVWIKRLKKSYRAVK